MSIPHVSTQHPHHAPVDVLVTWVAERDEPSWPGIVYLTLAVMSPDQRHGNVIVTNGDWERSGAEKGSHIRVSHHDIVWTGEPS